MKELVGPAFYNTVSLFLPHPTPCDKAVMSRDATSIFRKYGGVLHNLTLDEARQHTAQALARLRNQAEARRNNPLLRLGEKTCSFEHIAPNARIVPLLGTGRGGIQPQYHFPKEPQATTRIDVLVKRHPYPIILVLRGISPNIWNLEIEDDAELAAVFVISYMSQAVANLPSGVPIEFMVDRQGYRESCRPFTENLTRATLNVSGQPAPEMPWPVEDLRGVPIYFNRDKNALPTPNRFIVAPNGASASSEDWTPPPIVRDQMLVMGELAHLSEAPLVEGMTAGFEVLVQQGKARHTTAEDIRAWEMKAEAAYKDLVSTKPPSHHLKPGEAFTVLEPIKLPTAMAMPSPYIQAFSGFGVRIIVPEGVPIPDDDGSANSYYFIKDGSNL
ncbi:MAG: hypothetical protein NUV50_07240 [Rhodospirillales bacterium]|nr:hypothetical protein [Rhodospirillales bacterium]